MFIIGEKLNSTRERVKLMIEKRDVKGIQDLALQQVESGANMLDINSSAASGDKLDNMEWMVKTVQQVAAIPLCIDSPNTDEIEIGLKSHNENLGKALVNSITGENEKIDRLLPIIKKYNCSAVALVMDDQGIPDTAEKRIIIAKKLIVVLRDAGVAMQDIYIDPLVMPIGTDDRNGLIVLDTIKGVKESFPEVNTVIGLSNISYGLPERKLINQVFMILAMSGGLDAAIIDPTDKKLLTIIKTALTLLGKDNYCGEYIKSYREGRLVV
jgi:cobalamin-dependent methionine synthase I